MAGKTQTYHCALRWTGNTGRGTSGYTSYSRDHFVSAPGKPDLPGSSDAAFRGDGARYNPEELLLAALSACHMLWYLHLAADAGVVVEVYRDRARATMVEDAMKGGYFTGAELNPEVVIARGGDLEKAQALHAAAHAKCFIANSVNFPVTVEAQISMSAA